MLSPDQVDKALSRYRPADVDDQDGKKSSLLGWAEVDGPAVDLDLNCPQDSEPHQLAPPPLKLLPAYWFRSW